MYDTEKLTMQRTALITKMQGMLERAEAANRGFSVKENTEYEELEDQLDAIDRKIKSAKETNDLRNRGSLRIAGGDNNGFRNLGEYLYTVVHNPGDGRLQELRAQTTKDGTAGGFSVPSQFSDQFMSVPAVPAVIRPRATVLPAGDSPDAEISIPALDQRTSQGGSHMYGGITVFHQGEGDQLTESNFRVRKITLKPKKLTAYLTASSELLANWDAASATIPMLMRSAVDGAEDTDFLSGDGINKSQGILNSPAAISINRATASQIGWADVRNMLSRLRVLGGSPVWTASQTTMSQLVQISDASSRAIWTPSAVEGVPNLLYGFPVLFHDRSPALGTRGDLCLCDYRGYLIKNGSGPNVAVSEHFRFQNDEVCFRLTWHTDGQSWLNSPIALEGSTSNTVSPFVVLDTP